MQDEKLNVRCEDRKFIDEFSKEEIDAMMDEAEYEAMNQLVDPESGEPLSRDVAQRRIDNANARERDIKHAKAIEMRKRISRRRATKEMAKRDKRNKRSKKSRK